MFNFVFTHSGPTNTVVYNRMTAVPIPADIGSFKMFFMQDIPTLYGLQMFDRTGNMVYESERKYVFTNYNFRCVKTVLKDGERIVGIKSHSNDKHCATHSSF